MSWGVKHWKHMTEPKYFRNPLSAYTHRAAIGMQQMHEAVVARYKGDMKTYFELLPKAQETFLMVDRLWDSVPFEEQQFFLEIIGETESSDE